MKRFIGNLVVLALVGALASFVAAPAVAFFAIRSAAEAEDVAGLAGLIDFAAVRQSLRPQLSARPEAMTPPPSFLEDPIGAVRRQLERNPVVGGPDVDAYLTPDALAGLTRGEGRAVVRRPSPSAAPAPTRRAPWPQPRFWGVNRARLAVGGEGAQTVFTFARRGPFEWKLVHIGLPDPAQSAPAAARR